ncbi:hypothetical protein PF004_g3647 [Phytophthora fragariae]|uniref:Uncharacterized protein n=1 Tax=Phytophthora fragariae TaxID=53985 RepID=A0A6G0PLC0_9STRA|nr:hypothetical protein PF004_g3647 [Phytophthora fragariae]
MVDSSKHLLDNVDNVRLHHDLYTSGRPLRHRRGHYAQLDPMQMKDVCAMYKGGQANKKNLIIFGYVETELSLRQFLEDRGHEFVVTSKTTRSSPSSCTTAALHRVGPREPGCILRPQHQVDKVTSNVVSVADHVDMMILSLVRNYMPAYNKRMGHRRHRQPRLWP